MKTERRQYEGRHTSTPEREAAWQDHLARKYNLERVADGLLDLILLSHSLEVSRAARHRTYRLAATLSAAMLDK